DPTIMHDADDSMLLRWLDAARNSDVTVAVDPNSGVPHELRRTIGGTDLVLTVTYSQWNEPVEIAAPEGL
ncbi:hypothetical protein ABTB03_20370, partial [Acinetobacter baumannii]